MKAKSRPLFIHDTSLDYLKTFLESRDKEKQNAIEQYIFLAFLQKFLKEYIEREDPAITVDPVITAGSALFLIILRDGKQVAIVMFDFKFVEAIRMPHLGLGMYRNIYKPRLKEIYVEPGELIVFYDAYAAWIQQYSNLFAFKQYRDDGEFF